MEDEEEVLGLNPPHVERSALRRLEECKEPEELPKLVSPCCVGVEQHENSSPLWSSLPRLDTMPSIPSCPLPEASTPLPTKGVSLFASFSSSPSSQGMWQYDKKAYQSSFLSPRTTDAVFEANKKSAETLWCSPEAHHDNNVSNDHITSTLKPATIPNLPPMAPPLLPDHVPANSQDLPQQARQPQTHDGPPTIICCRSGSSSSSFFEFDDDEVSLLADNPDEDDAGVLPHATYDVLVNILDEIDKDDEENAVAVIEE